METKLKLLILLLGLGVFGVSYWSFFSDDGEKVESKSVTKSKSSEKSDINLKSSKVSEKITNEVKSEKNPNIVNYKDVFKEPKEMQTEVEKMVERDELKELDKEVNSLISEADELIKKRHLTLSVQEIPEDVKAGHQAQVEAMEEKLKKLKTFRL